MTAEPNEPRRRKPAAGPAQLRAAKTFVSAYREKLGAWNARLANLQARSTRVGPTLVRSEARQILVTIIVERRRLATDLEGAGDEVRTHSVIRDLERSLLHLDKELRTLGGVVH